MTCPKSQCQLGLGPEPGIQTPGRSPSAGIKIPSVGGQHLRAGGGGKCSARGFSLFAGWVSLRGHSPGSGGGVLLKRSLGQGGEGGDWIRTGGEVGGASPRSL